MGRRSRPPYIRSDHHGLRAYPSLRGWLHLTLHVLTSNPDFPFPLDRGQPRRGETTWKGEVLRSEPETARSGSLGEG